MSSPTSWWAQRRHTRRARSPGAPARVNPWARYVTGAQKGSRTRVAVSNHHTCDIDLGVQIGRTQFHRAKPNSLRYLSDRFLNI